MARNFSITADAFIIRPGPIKRCCTFLCCCECPVQIKKPYRRRPSATCIWRLQFSTLWELRLPRILRDAATGAKCRREKVGSSPYPSQSDDARIRWTPVQEEV